MERERAETSLGVIVAMNLSFIVMLICIKNMIAESAPQILGRAKNRKPKSLHFKKIDNVDAVKN